MLTELDVQKRWRQAGISLALLVGSGLFLLLFGSGAPALAAQSGKPAHAVASGVGIALPASANAPLPAATPCVPGNANYTVKQTTGVLVPGTADVGLHCSECSTTINLPFAYRLYDRTFTTAIVTS